MVQTTEDILTVNGVVLNTLAKNISSIAGRLRAPAHRTDNIAIPGMHGELWVPNKKYQANTITLPMWIQGCDDDGAIPDDSSKRKEFFKNYNALVGLFKDPELLDVQWHRPDGTIRQCWAESTDMFDFTTDLEGLARLGVVLTIPAAFWQDVDEKEQVFVGNLATVKPSKFVGGSAPIEDMVYTIAGPWTNVHVVFPDGSFFKYNAAITAGQGLVVDSGEWDLTGTGGLTPDFTKLVHDGADAHWGALPAMPAAAETITLNGTARTSATSFTMRGRRKYLIG